MIHVYYILLILVTSISESNSILRYNSPKSKEENDHLLSPNEN